MTNEQLSQRLTDAGVPPGKVGIAAGQLIYAFANLLADAGLLDANPENNAVRELLFERIVFPAFVKVWHEDQAALHQIRLARQRELELEE